MSKAGKGDTRRPCLIPKELEEKHWKLALGKITFREYEKWYKEWKKKQQGGGK